MFKRYMLMLCLCLAAATAWDSYMPAEAMEWWAMLGSASGSTMIAIWLVATIGLSAIGRWVYNGRDQQPAK